MTVPRSHQRRRFATLAGGMVLIALLSLLWQRLARKPELSLSPSLLAGARKVADLPHADGVPYDLRWIDTDSICYRYRETDGFFVATRSTTENSDSRRSRYAFRYDLPTHKESPYLLLESAKATLEDSQGEHDLAYMYDISPKGDYALCRYEKHLSGGRYTTFATIMKTGVSAPGAMIESQIVHSWPSTLQSRDVYAIVASVFLEGSDTEIEIVSMKSAGNESARGTFAQIAYRLLPPADADKVSKDGDGQLRPVRDEATGEPLVVPLENLQPLGQSANKHCFLLASADALKKRYELYDLDMTRHPVTFRNFSLQVPKLFSTRSANAACVGISPDGTRLAWTAALLDPNAPPLPKPSAFANIWGAVVGHDPAAPYVAPEKPPYGSRHGIWISDVSGTYFRELGRVPAPSRYRSVTPVLTQVGWVPGGDRLGFLFDNALYTVPVPDTPRP